MAKAIYKRGEIRTAKHVATADVAVNDIVVAGIVGEKPGRIAVARSAIPNATAGIVGVSGVFRFPKVSAAVIKTGQSVNWDASEGAVDDHAQVTEAGDVTEFGCAMEDAGDAV